MFGNNALAANAYSLISLKSTHGHSRCSLDFCTAISAPLGSCSEAYSYIHSYIQALLCEAGDGWSHYTLHVAARDQHM